MRNESDWISEHQLFIPARCELPCFLTDRPKDRVRKRTDCVRELMLPSAQITESGIPLQLTMMILAMIGAVLKKS
jgi:hypothetical protein